MIRKLTFVLFATLFAMFHPANVVSVAAQGPQEGIKVHGHWTIDVRQADGTLVTHRDFENSLAGGNTLLTLLLTRQLQTTGLWAIVLTPASSVTSGDATSSPCLTPTGSTVACGIFEPSDASSLPGSKTLSVASQNNNTLVVLSGSITAGATGTIRTVGTLNSGGAYGNYAPFSGTTLTQPISIAAGQIIQVTVTISFS